ncbi:MAG: hypothetical protein IT447_16255 [Phycisphaerales bacterium]|nr:hypothetical protein [Phycisphaerales bacterium]
MSSEFISPNWHVILIHYPVALLTLGVLIEFFSFFWRRSGFRAAGRWMLLLGTVLAVPAVLSGLYALNDVVQLGIPEADRAMTWHAKVAASTLTNSSWHMLIVHLREMSISTGIALVVVVLWLACSDRWRKRLHIPLLIAMLFSVGLLFCGAWHSGEAVYRHAVGVESTFQLAQKLDVVYFLPPLQTHLLLAGLMVAVALIAVGLSIRAAVTYGTPLQPMSEESLEGYAQRPVTDVSMAFTGRPQSPGVMEFPAQPPARVPSARFWLLAFVLGLLTAGAGVWFLALDSQTCDFQQLREIIPALPRRTAHVITGVNLVVLTLILTILARWAPRKKFLLSIFVILLLAGVTLQLWFGTLLLFDGPQGPLTGFNKDESAIITDPIPTTLPTTSTATTTTAPAQP